MSDQHSDRHIGSSQSVPEAWAALREDSLPEPWAPELQCHRVGGSAWSVFPQRFVGAISENEAHVQAVRRPRPTHAQTSAFDQAAFSHGAVQRGHWAEASAGGDVGGDRDCRVVEDGVIRDPTDWRSDPQAPRSFPPEYKTRCLERSDGRRLGEHEDTMLRADAAAPPRRRSSRQRSGSWSDQQLAATVAAIDVGCQLATAARDFGILATSLRDHFHGSTLKRKRGRQGVLIVEEESALVRWMLDMQDHAHPVSVLELRRKVAEMTQEHWTPFKDGIPRRGWLRWFCNRHPDLTLRSPQGLEEGRVRGLNPSSVASLYENLQRAYDEHRYLPSHIWNADESGAQAGRGGGGTLVFAQRGTRSVHSILPNSKEHLTVLTCVNAVGQFIPNFYIFKGKRNKNYILKCEPGACMAIQANGWMTAFLFSAWILHFTTVVQEKYRISQENRHLLILDGHGSHVTLEVVQKAKAEGLDIITLPSHTSHRLQPLDVSIFKSFKTAFRSYRDRWTVANKGRGAKKEELVEWVAMALRKALTEGRIQKGFVVTGIWPLCHQPWSSSCNLVPATLRQQWNQRLTLRMRKNRRMSMQRAHRSAYLKLSVPSNNTLWTPNLGATDHARAAQTAKARRRPPHRGAAYSNCRRLSDLVQDDDKKGSL